MNTDRFRFRVWDDAEQRYLNPKEFVIDSQGKIIFIALSISDHKQKDITIEQCTGLKDKNGKLIFEGDVVRYYRSTAMCLGGERIAQVLWYERDAEFGILTTLGDGYNMWEALMFGIEIIGNIHDEQFREVTKMVGTLMSQAKKEKND